MAPHSDGYRTVVGLPPTLRNPVRWAALRGPAVDALRSSQIWGLHLALIHAQERARGSAGWETVRLARPREGEFSVLQEPTPVAFLQAVAYVEAMGEEAYDRMLWRTEATAIAVDDLAAVTEERRRERQKWERTFGPRAGGEGGSRPAPVPDLSTRRWKRSPALLFLHARLRSGRPRRATRLIADAERLGISRRTLKRAKRELGVVTYRGAPDRPVRWRLPRR